MNKTFVKYLFIIAFFLIGKFAHTSTKLIDNKSNNSSTFIIKNDISQLGFQISELISPKFSFSNKLQFDKKGDLFVEELEEETEEECSEKFLDQFQELIHFPIFSNFNIVYFSINSNRNFYNPFTFSHTTLSRCILFQVFLI